MVILKFDQSSNSSFFYTGDILDGIPTFKLSTNDSVAIIPDENNVMSLAIKLGNDYFITRDRYVLVDCGNDKVTAVSIINSLKAMGMYPFKFTYRVVKRATKFIESGDYYKSSYHIAEKYRNSYPEDDRDIKDVLRKLKRENRQFKKDLSTYAEMTKNYYLRDVPADDNVYKNILSLLDRILNTIHKEV